MKSVTQSRLLAVTGIDSRAEDQAKSPTGKETQRRHGRPRRQHAYQNRPLVSQESLRLFLSDFIHSQAPSRLLHFLHTCSWSFSHDLLLVVLGTLKSKGYTSTLLAKPSRSSRPFSALADFKAPTLFTKFVVGASLVHICYFHQAYESSLSSALQSYRHFSILPPRRH